VSFSVAAGTRRSGVCDQRGASRRAIERACGSQVKSPDRHDKERAGNRLVAAMERSKKLLEQKKLVDLPALREATRRANQAGVSAELVERGMQLLCDAYAFKIEALEEKTEQEEKRGKQERQLRQEDQKEMRQVKNELKQAQNSERKKDEQIEQAKVKLREEQQRVADLQRNLERSEQEKKRLEQNNREIALALREHEDLVQNMLAAGVRPEGGDEQLAALRREPIHRPPPDCLCDSITTDLFEDPVLTIDGHAYEKEQIEAWLKINRTSPKTNKPLTDTRLVKCYALRDICNYWRENFPPEKAADNDSR